MKSPDQHVDIRELQADLYVHIDRVRSGESFVITDQGIPVGELIPHQSSLTAIDRIIAQGRTVHATRRIGLGFTPTGHVTSDVSDRLIESRNEERLL